MCYGSLFVGTFAAGGNSRKRDRISQSPQEQHAMANLPLCLLRTASPCLRDDRNPLRRRDTQPCNPYKAPLSAAQAAHALAQHTACYCAARPLCVLACFACTTICYTVLCKRDIYSVACAAQTRPAALLPCRRYTNEAHRLFYAQTNNQESIGVIGRD